MSTSGVGRALAEHALGAAAQRGYPSHAVQPRRSDQRARDRAQEIARLRDVGHLPGAFLQHGEEIDALVMLRRLDAAAGEQT